MAKERRTTTVRLEHRAAQLDDIAKRLGCSRHALILRAVDRLVERDNAESGKSE